MDVSRVITGAVGWAAGVFQTIERRGGPIPAGPVLVVANHPNSLLDPLVIFKVAGRPTRPLAKAPLFDQKFIGTLLRGLGGLPVYRAMDDPTQMHRNEDTFRGAIAALVNGDAVQIYPEGRSHSEPSLAELRTGAARIALGAEQQSDWKLGLRIVPIGLTYRQKHTFRGRVVALIGEPFTIDHLRALHAADAHAAGRALTDEISHRLHELTLNVAEHRDAELIDVAERLYVREKGMSGWRERDPLVERLPRMRAFARGLTWLREHHHARYERLARAVARYQRRAQLLGVHDGDVPPRYTFGGTLRYMLTRGTVIVIGAPFALVGSFIWYPTWWAPNVTLRLVKHGHEGIATYKLATGFVMVPLTTAIGVIVGALIDGVRGAVIALIGVPLLGFIAMEWRDRWHEFREDARLFFRVLLRRDHQERLARDRAKLVAEFDALVEETNSAGISPQQVGSFVGPAQQGVQE